MYLIVNCPRSSKIAPKFRTVKRFSRYRSILTVLIQKRIKTAWSTKISMPFLSSVKNLLIDAYIIFQESVDSLEIEHKTCYFVVRGAVSP